MSLFKVVKGLFRKNIRIKDKGKNNVVEIGSLNKALSPQVVISIRGNNNRVVIKDQTGTFKMKLSIFGNNNVIEIDSLFGLCGAVITCGNVYNLADNTMLKISEGTSIGRKFEVLLYNSKNKCFIGKDCMFSDEIKIRCGELPHIIYDTVTKENLDVSEGVHIGNHVWVGERCYIMKRAKIADNCIVGSAAVVTKTFDEQNVLIAGNPAKICKKNIGWKIREESLENV